MRVACHSGYLAVHLLATLVVSQYKTGKNMLAKNQNSQFEIRHQVMATPCGILYNWTRVHTAKTSNLPPKQTSKCFYCATVLLSMVTGIRYRLDCRSVHLSDGSEHWTEHKPITAIITIRTYSNFLDGVETGRLRRLIENDRHTRTTRSTSATRSMDIRVHILFIQYTLLTSITWLTFSNNWIAYFWFQFLFC